MAKRFWDTSSFSGVFVRNLTLGVLKLTRQNTLINTALTRFLPIPSEQSWLVTPNTVQGEEGQLELYFLKHKVSLTFWPQEEREWHHSDPLAARKMPVVMQTFIKYLYWKPLYVRRMKLGRCLLSATGMEGKLWCQWRQSRRNKGLH